MIIDQEWISIISLVVGAISLTVSAAALVAAVRQIRKTQSAAESAASAAREARDVVHHVSVVSDLSQISVQIELIKELHRNEEWTRAIDRYSLLRRLLTEARVRLPQETHATLNVAIIQFREMEQNANKALADNAPISHSVFNNELVDLQQSLEVIRVWIEDELSSVSVTGEQ